MPNAGVIDGLRLVAKLEHPDDTRERLATRMQ